jgi:hypothetical protein
LLTTARLTSLLRLLLALLLLLLVLLLQLLVLALVLLSRPPPLAPLLPSCSRVVHGVCVCACSMWMRVLCGCVCACHLQLAAQLSFLVEVGERYKHSRVLEFFVLDRLSALLSHLPFVAFSFFAA